MSTQRYRQFVILSEPRTGSTVISNKFGLIEGIHCQGEIFHPEEIYTSVNIDSIPSLSSRNKKPVEFLDVVLDETFKQKGNPTIIGFKLFFDHNTQITQHILDTGMPVILLERKNKLAQYSSLKIAKKTGRWHSKQKLTKQQEEDNRINGSLVSFSILELLAFSIRSWLRFTMIRRRLVHYGCPYHYVEYEKVLESNEWKKIVDFLKIDVTEYNFQPSLKRQRKGDLYSGFSNPRYAKAWCKILMAFSIFGIRKT